MKTIKCSRGYVKLLYIFGHFCLKGQIGFFYKFMATLKKLVSVKLELEITLPLRLSSGPVFLIFFIFKGTLMQI